MHVLCHEGCYIFVLPKFYFCHPWQKWMLLLSVMLMCVIASARHLRFKIEFEKFYFEIRCFQFSRFLPRHECINEQGIEFLRKNCDAMLCGGTVVLCRHDGGDLNVPTDQRMFHFFVPTQQRNITDGPI